jgi:two-component system cell cycle response regulator
MCFHLATRRADRPAGLSFRRSLRRELPALPLSPYSFFMPGRLLIVDDDPDTCEFLRMYFVAGGYQVDTRLDGPSALEVFRADPHDAVITDIRMPNMDGIQVLRALKSIDPDVSVIIVSASVIEERTKIAIDAMRGGAADYFVKPLGDPAELERAVVSGMAQRAQRRESTRRLRELEQRARTDPLTGLANRTELEQRLREEFSRLGRGALEFSLAIFDIDSFKQINDRYGHIIGDQVLTAVAQALQDGCRAYDIKARYGGDEFVVVMPHTRLDMGIAVAEKIRRAVAALTFAADGSPLAVTVSAGVTSTRRVEEIAPDALVERADRGLYAAKAAGRNQIVPVPPTESGGPPENPVLRRATEGLTS